ncbi:hypothetical protein D3C81_2226060 [compost metagenome]
MIDRDRPGGTLDCRQAEQRHQHAGLGAQVNLIQVGFILLPDIHVLHDDEVTIVAGVNGRYLAITVCAV